MDQYDEVERELDRVVDRLNSMPLTKAAQAHDACYTAAEAIRQQTRLIDPDMPDEPLPELAPQGLGALIAVLGGDWLAAARASRTPDPTDVRNVLLTLRRAI